MRLASKLSTVALLLLLAVASTGAGGATLPVDFGTAELGEIVSRCFYVCFGPDCSAPGTVNKIDVDPPFFARGLRIAATGSADPCGPAKSLTTADQKLPLSVGAGEAVVFDIDLLPIAPGDVAKTLSINGRDELDLVARLDAVLDCSPGSTALCLSDERFKVRSYWRAFDGARGAGRPVPGNSADSGLFWFFDANIWEAMVKVLDACSLNDRYWVFAAATTNVEQTLTVTDTATQTVKAYFTYMGPPAPAITDTSAFATCP